MGVAGLWDILRPVGQVRSLTHLAVTQGFEANPDGKRGFRIGIDASIWFFHAAYGKEGENPELRTLFFRCCKLMNMPFLPLFVFDGPKRPSVKRGKRVSGNSHWLTTGMKNIIEAFGFEWRTAPGEAEAELAYLNRMGVIDAVLSDDVDNFLFGAVFVIRNPSNTLSGNRANPTKNADGRDDGNHTVTYNVADIASHPDIELTRGGMVLIGLLSGGDYHQAGVTGCGKLIAAGLARCGFGDSLLKATQRLSRDELPAFLSTWRAEIRQELRSNSMGYIGSKKPALAKKIPEDFPDIDILLSYTNPIISETEGKSGRNQTAVNWDREPDLGKVAGLCELYFEWGVKDVIIKRFRTVLWPSAVLRILRRAAIDLDKEKPISPSTPTKSGSQTSMPIGTPSKMITKYFSSMKLDSPKKPEVLVSDDDDDDEERLIVKIHSSRTHASTDGILEYRLEVAPAQLVRLSEAGVKGIRPPIETDDVFEDSEGDDGEDDEDSGKRKTKGKKPPPNPDSHLRIWMPACMVKMVEPHLTTKFEEAQEMKLAKKLSKTTSAVRKKKAGKKSGLTIIEEGLSTIAIVPKLPPPKPTAPPSKLPLYETSESEDASSDHELPVIFPQRLARRPFPVFLAEEPGGKLSDDGEDPFLQPLSRAFHYSPPQSPVRCQRKKSPDSSESETYLSRMKKSPKKCQKHVSPRSKHIDSGTECSRANKPLPPRNISPTPKARSDDDIIEISSDSDSSPVRPSKVLHPLLVARARVNGATIGTQQAKKQPEIHPTSKSASIPALSIPKQRISFDSDDLIDLT